MSRKHGPERVADLDRPYIRRPTLAQRCPFRVRILWQDPLHGSRCATKSEKPCVSCLVVIMRCGVAPQLPGSTIGIHHGSLRRFYTGSQPGSRKHPASRQYVFQAGREGEFRSTSQSPGGSCTVIFDASTSHGTTCPHLRSTRRI